VYGFSITPLKDAATSRLVVAPSPVNRSGPSHVYGL
jgi:hypothetical protein